MTPHSRRRHISQVRVGCTKEIYMFQWVSQKHISLKTYHAQHFGRCCLWRKQTRGVAPQLPAGIEAKQMRADGLGLTLLFEFRSEPPGHAEKLCEYRPDYYRSVTSALTGEGLGFKTAGTADSFDNSCSDSARRWSPASWWLQTLSCSAKCSRSCIRSGAVCPAELPGSLRHKKTATLCVGFFMS